MNRLLFGAVAIASVALAAPTFAADMPVKAPPSVAAPSAYNWNGCYFGGNGGGKWLHTSGSLDLLGSSFDVTGGSSGSLIGGGQLGCNYQISQLVFGIEGDADWQHLSRTVTFGSNTPLGLITTNGAANVTSNWQASVRTRLGYAAGNVLWYATGGVSFTRATFSGAGSFCFLDPCPPLEPFDIVPVSKTLVGGTAGLGFEYAMGPQLTLGLEARYTWYGSQNFNTIVTDPMPAVGNMNLNSSEIMGKVNWKFGSNEQPRERR
jgi:outer membrane immunogenic protein